MIVPLLVDDAARLYCDRRGCPARLEAKTAREVRATAAGLGWQVEGADLCPQCRPAMFPAWTVKEAIR